MYLVSHSQGTYIAPLPSGSAPGMPVRAAPTPMTATVQIPPQIPGPPGPQGPPGTPGTFAETLEQRIYDLLAPFRSVNLFGDGNGEFDLPSHEDEIKALILCENIAFLIRHNQSGYGKRIEPTDIAFATKNWAAKTTGKGVVGIGCFVNGNGFSHTIVMTTVGRDEDVVDRLAAQAELLLQQFFPGI